jgi:hypothetical protein
MLVVGKGLVVLGRNDNRIVNLSQYLSPTLAFIYVNLLFWDMWNPTLFLMFAMESEGSSLGDLPAR